MTPSGAVGRRVRMASGYFRDDDGEDFVTLCDACATNRWGDPNDETVDAFMARHDDPERWCWTNSLTTDPEQLCLDCGKGMIR